MSKQLEPLFKELDHFIQSSNYVNAISICDKILKLEPEDKDAFQCKVVALIQNDSIDEALNVIKSNSKLGSEVKFETAYCLYRQKNYKEALAILGEIPSPKSLKLLELEARVLYRLEDYSRSVQLYSSIIKENKTDSRELLTNLLAAYVGCGELDEAKKFIAGNKSTLQNCFEFAFNAACIEIVASNYETAESYLLLAKSVCLLLGKDYELFALVLTNFVEICKEAMTEDGATDEEIANEMAPIDCQLAFLYQIQGRTEEAMNLYNSVLKAKPSDESISAVASNNVVALKQEHNLFDSFRKLKQATSQNVEQKLSSKQKKVIGFNRCLLLLHMNKIDQCKELINSLQQQFPNSSRIALIQSALLIKEKKASQSGDILQAFAQQHPDSSLRVQLSLAQIHLNNGNIKEAIGVLDSISSLKNKPGMIATLLSLYEQIQDKDGALRILDSYISWWESQKQKDEEQYIKVLKETANFNLKHKRFKEAAAIYEKILKLNQNDLEVLPNLIIALSRFDPKLAEKYSERLPQLTGESVIDVESLENAAVAPKLTSKQKATEPTTEQKTDKIVEKKKKKKKKRPLPKNLDPNKPPDPERWIPLRQRSYFKRRMSKKKRSSEKDQIEKGAQGAVGVGRSVKEEKEKELKLAQEKEKANTSPPTQHPSPTINPKAQPKESTKLPPNAAKKKPNKKKKR